MMETAEEYDDRAPGLLRHHDTDCTAYNTKGRDIEDQPCTCGARVPSARDAAVALASKRELLAELWGEAMRLHDSYDGRRPVAESFCSAHTLLSSKYSQPPQKSQGGGG